MTQIYIYDCCVLSLLKPGTMLRNVTSNLAKKLEPGGPYRRPSSASTRTGRCGTISWSSLSIAVNTMR